MSKLKPHVIHKIQRPDPVILALYREQSAATIHEAMGRRGAMDSRIKPIYSGMKVVGQL